MIYIFWSAANIEEARKVVKKLLEVKYIACASVIPQVLSLYYWEGKLQEDNEAKVIIKTKKILYKKVLDEINEKSSYEVPEVSMVEVKDGSPRYLKWLEDFLGNK